MEIVAEVPQVGRVEWIGLSQAALSAIQPVREAVAEVGTGLVGDHHSKRHKGGKRQVTLVMQEHFAVVRSLCAGRPVTPEQLRRNIVVSGINLLSLKQRRFQIGEAIFVGTGPCDPCSRMESTLGPGGYQAMRGHGGLTARVEQRGRIAIGDAVRVLPDESSTPEM